MAPRSTTLESETTAEMDSRASSRPSRQAVHELGHERGRQHASEHEVVDDVGRVVGEIEGIRQAVAAEGISGDEEAEQPGQAREQSAPGHEGGHPPEPGAGAHPSRGGLRLPFAAGGAHTPETLAGTAPAASAAPRCLCFFRRFVRIDRIHHTTRKAAAPMDRATATPEIAVERIVMSPRWMMKPVRVARVSSRGKSPDVRAVRWTVTMFVCGEILTSQVWPL